jgi:type II secretory pathway component PulM
MATVGEVFYGRRAYRVQDSDRPHLERITTAAAELEAARGKLALAVSSAREADVPLRAIASAANVSHEQVRRMAKRSQ